MDSYLKDIAKNLAASFAAVNETGYKLQIEISGLADKPSALIEYTLSCNYGLNSVSGNKLDAVLEEYLRRRSFRNAHTAKALPFQPEKKDDIPF